MKKKLIFVAVILSLVIPTVSNAVPTDFSGGVSNEYLYEEVVFITGVPIKFAGEIKISKKEKSDSSSVTYKMDLLPVTKDKKTGKLPNAEYKKSVTYDTEYLNHGGIGQTIGKTTVGKYSETLEIGEVEYELEDYQFFKSDTIDNRPASDFYSGDITARKYYTVEGSSEDGDIAGTVTIDISGTNSGYENFWGGTETQSIDYSINSNIALTIEESEAEGDDSEKNELEKIITKPWTGTVNFKTSDSLTKTLRYSTNDAHHSSFEGAHVKVTNEEEVSKYRYSLPEGFGTLNLNLAKVPKLDRLIVPKFRDVNGHWAAENIEKLYSLDVFGEGGSIFSPNTPMNRLDFTKAVVKACDIKSSLEDKTSSRRKTREESMFNDLSVNHEDYQYVKDAVEKKIIAGSQDIFGNRIFKPEKNLSRAEAITILIRALGFENRAPNPGYSTSFDDDEKIPSWAKDSIYMAKEIDLIKGDTSNRVNPEKELSRAEASTMLVKFLEFLERDLQKDYRENIINFN